MPVCMVAPPIPPEPIRPPEPLDRVSMPASRSPDGDEPPHPLAAPNSNRIAGQASERIEREIARVARASRRRSRAAPSSGNRPPPSIFILCKDSLSQSWTVKGTTDEIVTRRVVMKSGGPRSVVTINAQIGDAARGQTRETPGWWRIALAERGLGRPARLASGSRKKAADASGRI